MLYYLCVGSHPFEDAAKLSILNGSYKLPAMDTHAALFNELIRAFPTNKRNQKTKRTEGQFLTLNTPCLPSHCAEILLTLDPDERPSSTGACERLQILQTAIQDDNAPLVLNSSATKPSSGQGLSQSSSSSVNSLFSRAVVRLWVGCKGELDQRLLTHLNPPFSRRPVRRAL